MIHTRPLGRRMPLLAAAFLLSATFPPARAHETEADSRWLVSTAELIFQGVVTAVDYRVSDVVTPKEDVPIPHTFVTFRIERIWKGRPETQGSITLRFEGGLDAATDDVLELKGVPLFDAGERAILFVRGNTKRLCPVAGWDRGRYRIVDGLLYSEYGAEVWLTGKNEFVLGPSKALPEALNHSIAGVPFQIEESPVSQAAWTPLPGWRRADAAAFSNALAQLVKELHTSQELALLPPVRSARIAEKFVVKEAQPAAPPPNLK